MTAYLVLMYVHLATAVLYVGYFLFWGIMARGLATATALDPGPRYLDLIHHAAWPPEGVPTPVRVPLHVLGWVFYVVLVVSGVLVLAQGDPGPTATFGVGGAHWIRGAKIVLVGLLGLVHLRQLRSASERLIYVGGAALVAVVILSSWLVR